MSAPVVSIITTAPRSMASRRYRADAVAGELLKMGMDAAVRRQGSTSDTVRIYSKHFNFCDHAEASWFQAQGGKVIFDVCDNHLQHPEVGQHYRRMVRGADAVTCGSEVILHDVVALRGSDKHCYYIPDMVLGERRVYSVPKTKRYLWYGHNSNIPALIDILPTIGNVPLHIIGGPELTPDLFTAHQGDVELTEWSDTAVYDALKTAWAVLIPQREEDLMRGKGSNRALEAIWAGVPVVASATPEIMRANELGCIAGMIVHHSERWAQALGNFAGLDGMGQAIDAAQGAIAIHYAPRVIGAKWGRVIEGLNDDAR